MVDTRFVSVAVVALLVLSAGTAAAASDTVQVSPGPVHVTEDHQVDEPNVGVEFAELICIDTSGFEECVSTPFPTVEGGASVDLAVYQESNGCEGLQTEHSDCDGDGETEPPDDLVVAFEDGQVRQGLV